MKRLKYQVEDSTIAELLGVTNFATADSAVLEIVKNAYDAGASNLVIDIEEGKLTFRDDGFGMSSSDIEQNWMSVGKSSKGYVFKDRKGESRIQAGSKGVGRFALARLGSNVLLRSKRAGKDGVVWETDWSESILDEDNSLRNCGTVISIKSLRDAWTEKAISKLRDYLSKTYSDDKMKIEIHSLYGDYSVERYFETPTIGVNCTEAIQLCYDAGNQNAYISIHSDEFTDEAQALVEGVDIKHAQYRIDMVNELTKLQDRTSVEDFRELLKRVGSFRASFYFRLISSRQFEAEKFEYKHYKLANPIDSGIILYRNAFSINSYEGSRDWLGLGRRSRKSPASPSHESGAWRVRENQLGGYIFIDKNENCNLKDLANRQGLEEDEVYNVFVSIIESAISQFERYRQRIIRCIVKAKREKETREDEVKDVSVVAGIASGKLSLEQFSKDIFNQLSLELKDARKEEIKRLRKLREEKEHQQYESRLLNVLATVGLKTASIAHQLRNDENNIMNNSRYVREALVEYGLMDILREEENTGIASRDIPQLLEKGESINAKMVRIMDSLLEEVRKDRFAKTECNLETVMLNLIDRWQDKYAQLKIVYNGIGDKIIAIPEDAISVIFDNLILNSLQQNETLSPLEAWITIQGNEKCVYVEYGDNGIGLHEKYRDNPKRILEALEGTRSEGHGLGMWMVNNTLLGYKGEVIEVGSGNPGFRFSFRIGNE